jgi:hypothetical protein
MVVRHKSNFIGLSYMILICVYFLIHLSVSQILNQMYADGSGCAV